jgi:hypothetical protein
LFEFVGDVHVLEQDVVVDESFQDQSKDQSKHKGKNTQFVQQKPRSKAEEVDVQ